jgi:predicted permease
MEAVLQDFRYVLRRLRKSPGFTIVVVFMLALGIGANTAVFSVMNAILMQLLPVSHPEGLTYVRMANGQGQPPGAGNTGDSSTSFSEPVFEALRQHDDVFQELIGYVPLSFTGSVAVRHGELPEEAEGEEVCGNFFSGLGARIERGRGFALAEEKNHAQLVVLSYSFWTRSYARDPAALGQTLYVKGVPMTIIGIAARGFKGIEPATSTDFWIPLQSRPELNAWGAPAELNSLYGSPKWWALRMMARLRPGVTPMQAQQALSGTLGEVVNRTVGPFDPKQWKPLLDFVPVRGVGGYIENYRTPVLILMGLVGLVLLIACTNVAMIVQARNTVRRREFSVRLAIGAGRDAIFRHLLLESLLVVGAGASLGWLFAVSATQLLAAWSGIETGLSPDRTVLFFTLLISALAALIFGLVPLRSVMSASVADVLRSSSLNATTAQSRALGGRIVLAAQIAMCLVLLMAASLLVRTLRNYAKQDLGMQADGLLVFGITPLGQTDTHAFYRGLLDRLRQMPGVESVSMAHDRPGSGWSANGGSFMLDGVRKQGTLRSNDVGSGFFATMGIPLLAGRDVADSDGTGTPKVAVVNETFVKRYLGNTNPLGHVLLGCSIVGVARDSKYTSVDEGPTPIAYFARMQSNPVGIMHIELRTRGDALVMLPAVRKMMAVAYPDIPLEKPMTQRAQFEESYESQRMFTAMGGFFGVLAALLVATGLYGTYSFHVSRRITEIGVRMALGATRMQILAMVLRQTMWVLLAGLVAGIPLTFLAVRPLHAMLYQMSTFDPVSFVVAVAAVTVISGCAALLPARRAASVEPVEALRME